MWEVAGLSWLPYSLVCRTSLRPTRLCRGSSPEARAYTAVRRSTRSANAPTRKSSRCTRATTTPPSSWSSTRTEAPQRAAMPHHLNFGGPGPLPCSSRREAAVPRKPAAASAWPQKVSKALLLPFLLFRHARARPLGMHRAQRRVKSGGLLRLPARAKAAPRRALGGLCEGLRCPAAATTPVRHSVPCAPPPSLQVVQHRRGGARHAGAGAQGGALRGQPGRHLLRARRERRVHAVGRGDAPRLRGRLLRGLGAPLPRPTCLLPPARLTGHTAGSLIPAAPCLPPTRSAVMVRCLWPRPCLLGGPCAVSQRAP